MSGSAASGNDSPSSGSGESPSGSSKKGRGRATLTKEQRQVRNEVLSLLPPDLRQAIGNLIPTNIGQDIIAALATGQPRERTPQQLVEHRLMPRWNGYWAQKFYAGDLTPELGGGKRKRPFGPLSEMLADTAECGNLWCEDRHDFVTADACRQCEMRKVDHRADRNRKQPDVQDVDPTPQVPQQRHEQPTWWDCKRCEASGKGEPPASGLCRLCREEDELNVQPSAGATHSQAPAEEFASTSPAPF